jgi:hypothetical protein
MSRPHSSSELSFTKHPTKPSTYIPRRQKADHVIAWLAVCLGAAILSCVAFVIAHSF